MTSKQLKVNLLKTVTVVNTGEGRLPQCQTSTAVCYVVYLNINEGCEVELMSGPLTHKELITFILWQRVEELKEVETMAMKQGAKLKDTFFKTHSG